MDTNLLIHIKESRLTGPRDTWLHEYLTKAEVAKVSWAVGLGTLCLVNNAHMKQLPLSRSSPSITYWRCAVSCCRLAVSCSMPQISQRDTRLSLHQENHGQLSNRLFSARNLDLQRHTADLVRFHFFGSFETCNPHMANSHQCHSRIFRSPA